jgi:hypothetical protein
MTPTASRYVGQLLLRDCQEGWAMGSFRAIELCRHHRQEDRFLTSRPPKEQTSKLIVTSVSFASPRAHLVELSDL